ncbi:MAG: helix-turn-helix domain-containing protein [Bdellovibrionota bacterium]
MDSRAGLNCGADQTRSALLDAAKHFFALNGYEGTTVNQIVSRAGVNASLISYHFGGKKGIYRACLEKMGEAKLDAAKRILNPPRSVDELRSCLSLFIDELLNWYGEEPELTLIMLRECEIGSSAMVPIFEKTFLQIYGALEMFLNRAKH